MAAAIGTVEMLDWCGDGGWTVVGAYHCDGGSWEDSVELECGLMLRRLGALRDVEGLGNPNPCCLAVCPTRGRWKVHLMVYRLMLGEG